MAAPEHDTSTSRRLDPVALRRCVQRLHAAEEPPWLHAEVARRMASRLSILKHQPEVYIDWWSHLGASAELLRQAHPKARRLAVEPEIAGQTAAEPSAAAAWWSPRRWASRHDRTLAAAEVPPAAAALLWANMMLHGVDDPRRTMLEWHRALSVDGFLMFSTLGPGSLRGLRDLYRREGWPTPHAAFVDMHDLGDMLVRSGFADPVMDQEVVTLTWRSAAAMLAEMRCLGGNVDPDRVAGLRTPRWRKTMQTMLEQQADATGRVSMEFEIVYGHAVRPAPRPTIAGTTSIALDDMRTMVRRRARP